MNEFTIYKHQTNFEKELGRLRASALPAKTKKQIEDFAHIRLANGSSKLRVVKCMWKLEKEHFLPLICRLILRLKLEEGVTTDNTQ